MMDKPLSYAPVTICEGEQGSGKTNTAVARIVDVAFATITGVELPDGRIIPAKPLMPPQIGRFIFHAKGYEPCVVNVPKGGIVIPSTKIYTNFHLYGIKYKHLPLPLLLEYLNTGLIRDGYLVIDEGYIEGDAREGMTAVVRTITKLSMQIRKRHLYLIICTPHARLLDWRLKWVHTEHIMCSYNEKREEVTLIIKNRRKYRKPRVLTYDAKPYQKYFITDEIIEIPRDQIARALARAM